MASEHRYSTPPDLDFAVRIVLHRRRVFGTLGRGLSEQAMNLEVRNLTLPTGTPVALELECQGKEWRVDALVAHRDGNRLGVLFREPQPELYRALTQGDARVSPGTAAVSERPPVRPLLSAPVATRP